MSGECWSDGTGLNIPKPSTEYRVPGMHAVDGKDWSTTHHRPLTTSLAIGDFNSDGRPDVVVGERERPGDGPAELRVRLGVLRPAGRDVVLREPGVGPLRLARDAQGVVPPLPGVRVGFFKYKSGVRKILATA